jgi:hypothetical protein
VIEIEAHYEDLCTHPSDIHEHLPLLRELARRSEHVTEIGMRSGISTTALLAGQPKTLVSWDLNPRAIVSQRTLDLLTLAGETRFQPRVGDSLEIEIEATDFLFIDSLHTGQQLKAELARHGNKVRKWIAFHDTETFGLRGEDGIEPGLRAAIKGFQQDRFPLWSVKHDWQNNNGLVVLEHVRADPARPAGAEESPQWPRFK